MMRLLLFCTLFLAFLSTEALFSQTQDPVEWIFSCEADKDGDFIIDICAKVADGWYIYSQDNEDGGPVPTSIEFEKSSAYKLKGKIEESGDLKSGFDSTFEMQIKKYPGEVHFTQKVCSKKEDGKVSGSVYYMTCNDKMCLPPKSVPFEITIANKTSN